MTKRESVDFKNNQGLYGIFNDSFPPILDGVTLTVQNYAHWLSSMEMTPCVVTPWNPEPREYPYQVIQYFSLPIMSRKPYRYGYPKLDPFIWRKLRSTNFRLLHAHCPFSSGRLAVYVKKKQNLPLIGTFHSKYRQDLEHSFRRTPWCVPIIMKRILAFFNACDEVWIPQAYVEETVREYGYKGPLSVVENGNDFASLVQGDIFDFKRDAKRRMGFQDDEIVLLFVGQHIREKGVETIIESLPLIDSDVKFRMNFIGNGYFFEEMKSKIEALGLSDRVKLNGVIKERERLASFYAASDIFLFPSFYDNAPLVIREAAAMGTPTVLLEGSTAAEVIQDGKNGFLVKKDSKEFGSLISSLAKNRDKLKEVAMGSRESLVRSWEDVVGEVADRYNVIIRNYKK